MEWSVDIKSPELAVTLSWRFLGLVNIKDVPLLVLLIVSAFSDNLFVIRSRKDSKDQQWVFDQVSKTIKSVDKKERSIALRGSNAYAYNTDSRWYQLFKYDNGIIVNEKKEVISISGGLDHENRQVIREGRNDKQHQ
jgi:hypothetical protein